MLKNKWFQVQKDRYILPNKTEGDYFFVATKGASIIVPVTDYGKVVMIKQYRYLTKKVSIEFPMGGVEQGQTPLATAKAELLQEAGYEAKSFLRIGRFNPFIGITSEICHIYLARGLKKTEKDLDETEMITTIEFTPKQITKMIKDKKILSGQTIAAWQLAEQYFN